MKNVFLTIVFVLMMVSCSKDEKKEDNEPVNELHGTWKLTRFVAPFDCVSNYNGEILWTFNSNNTVDVVILPNTVLCQSLPLSASGNYSYSEGENYMIINEEYWWNLTLSNNQLSIDQDPTTDGRELKFTKVE